MCKLVWEKNLEVFGLGCCKLFIGLGFLFCCYGCFFVKSF